MLTNLIYSRTDNESEKLQQLTSFIQELPRVGIEYPEAIPRADDEATAKLTPHPQGHTQASAIEKAMPLIRKREKASSFREFTAWKQKFKQPHNLEDASLAGFESHLLSWLKEAQRIGYDEDGPAISGDFYGDEFCVERSINRKRMDRRRDEEEEEEGKEEKDVQELKNR